MSLLRVPGFVPLASGLALGLLADWGLRTALLIWVYALTKSGVAVSLVGLAESLPLLVLAPFAGVFVDRWHRARTMAMALVARAVLVAPLLLVHDRAQMPLVLVVTVLVNSASQFFLPAASASLPMVVGRDRVGEANSVLQITGGVVPVVAPGLFAGLYAAAGPHVMVMITALLYLVTAPVLAAVPAGRAERSEEHHLSFGADMAAGLRYMRHSRLLLALAAVAFVALLSMGGLSVLDVVFVVRGLHLPSEAVGVLLTAFGLGNLAGGVGVWLLSRWAARRYHLLLSIAAMVVAAATAVYAMSTSMAMATVALVVSGASFPSIMVAFSTLMQTATDDAYMGRVSSLTGMLMSVASIISLAGCGALTDLIGVRAVIALGAAIMACSGVVSLGLIRETPEPRHGNEHVSSLADAS